LENVFMLKEEIISKVLGRNKSLFEEDINLNLLNLKRNIEEKKILVIGGAGSIGSSFIKAIIRFHPKMIVVIDNNENGLTELVRDIRSDKDIIVPQTFVTYPVSFNSITFRKIYDKYKKFDIIANFAAHKHVRSEKDIYSIEALLYNNVIHAKDLIELIKDSKPDHFFCVSTDKAANPVNIMGASKKLMEEMILSYAETINITTARFANVAFSNGSLLEGFLNRIQKVQPIACPKDIRRFFVSPQESGEICMLACILGSSGDVFYPKLDASKDMIPFSSFLNAFLNSLGYEVLECSSEEEAKLNMNNISSGKYPVYFFNSDTSGEKEFEEFFTEYEVVNTNSFQKLGIISKKSQYTRSDMNIIIQKLEHVLSSKNVTKKNIVTVLKKIIPEFNHIEKGKSLDSKM